MNNESISQSINECMNEWMNEIEVTSFSQKPEMLNHEQSERLTVDPQQSPHFQVRPSGISSTPITNFDNQILHLTSSNGGI